MATASREGESLPQDLTRLADLRVQPLALAQFLLSVPDEVLKRGGELVMELLRDLDLSRELGRNLAGSPGRGER